MLKTPKIEGMSGVLHNRYYYNQSASVEKDHKVLDEKETEIQGITVIRSYLKTLPSRPGVYRMYDARDKLLYVGKAKNLRNRVTSYTQPNRLSNRILRMVSQTRSMEFVTTHTEVEALLLETNLIKKLKPHFNILMRDDKSFPYIIIRGGHDYPLMGKHRGVQKSGNDYFGPYASAGAVNRTLTILQKAFMLRNCSDTYFAGRTRPCLQYQIKRCTAPCVGRVSHQDYANQVAEAKAFLSGKTNDIQKKYADLMQQASEDLNFEEAATYRDRIRALTQIQAHQDINIGLSLGDADVFALAQKAGRTAIQIFFYRNGCNNGARAYFPHHDQSQSASEIMTAFIAQFYDNRVAPSQVLASVDVAETELLEEALSLKANRKVKILTPQRGDKKRALDHAVKNATEALERHLAQHATQKRLLAGVQELFHLKRLPERIEIYDNSHIQGAHALGAMVVAGPEGFLKSAYRRFNIKGAQKVAGAAGYKDGDDYAMMQEVMHRRFSRSLKEDPENAQNSWPDLVLIDGGETHLNACHEVFEELGISDRFVYVAIAKGIDRNAGRERFFRVGQDPFTLPVNDPVLYYLQRLRDEAHNFAITGHRQKRSKAISQSPLDNIAGIGPSRKKALLNHFGSAAEVAAAGQVDLEKVDGINARIAEQIYNYFHEK